LVNVRRRYFGAKPELHKTGLKYRNLTKRGEARLYPAHRLPAPGSHVLVCCGEFDALAARQAGIAAVTSTGGANFWCEGDEHLLDDYRVTVTYDPGEEPWAERVADRLGARHIPATWPRGTDLARLYAERGPAELRRLAGRLA
jgi:DNA primase